MIACPHPTCTLDLGDTFEVITLYGTTGACMYVECPDGHRFEVDVIPLTTAEETTR
ncbi:hypothetical protein ACGF0D_10535 [Kitasatospora sp. NPDC048298]|uniref:hypothetical protein n=1 Tax=Kitasatospora sp. NPDC048298 TaxID=3364049 RepID=UPI0037243E3B